jgi:hypothetical protein
MNYEERLNVISDEQCDLVHRPEECKFLNRILEKQDLCIVHSGEKNHESHEGKAHTTTARWIPALLSHG